MKPKRFRFSKTKRWVNLLLLMFAGAYTLLLGFALVFNSKSIGFLFIFLFVFLVWSIWIEWTYYIEFNEDQLIFRKQGLFKKLVKIAYTDVLYIRRSSRRSFIDVLTRDGKVMKLNTAVDGRVGALVDEFQKHLQENQIQFNIEYSYKKFSLYEKGLFSLCILFVFLAPFISPFRGLSSFFVWETVWPPAIYPPGNVESFWISSKQEIWLSFRKIFSDDWQIVKFTPDKKPIVFNVRGTLVKYPELILADELGRPWIVQGSVLFHLVNEDWQRFDLDKYTISSYKKPVVAGNSYWVSAYQEETDSYFLAEFNLNSGDIKTFDLPLEFRGKDYFIYQVQLKPDGQPVIAITKEYNPVYFYSMNNGLWKKEAEILDVEWVAPEFFDNLKPFLQFGSFTFDQQGNILVVLQRNSKSSIGKFNMEAAKWEWSSIENDCRLCSNRYDDIVVDKFERVWLRAEYASKKEENDKFYISDGRGVDVWLPAWGESARLIVRYTDENSGYEVGYGGDSMQLDNNGKIWSAGDRLVRIDSTKSELPKPLPFEFGRYIPFPYLIVFGFIGLFQIIYHFKLQKYDLSSPPEITA